MFTAIKTSKANKVLVTELTRRLNLGAENMIARLAFSYSLATNRKMNLLDIEDSQGKEYTNKVLFGEHADIYVGMIYVHYNINKAVEKDVAKYVKMHIDDGLKLIAEEVVKKDSINGMDFIINKIEKGLKALG